MNLKERLEKLYNDDSKHSTYQNIPDFVKGKLDYHEEIDESWRGDTARYQYILSEINNLKITDAIDIGANTGFFTLNLAYKYKDMCVTSYELNPNHCNFIRLIADEFYLKNIEVREQGVSLHEINSLGNTECGLFLNVLHHAGVDFDQDILKSKEGFEVYATQYLFELGKKMKCMFFQLGYNWGGDKQKPLATNLKEMMELVCKMVLNSGWNFKQVSFYGVYNDKMAYKKISISDINQLNKGNLDIDYSFLEEMKFEANSEFYKRPIFYLERNTHHK